MFFNNYLSFFFFKKRKKYTSFTFADVGAKKYIYINTNPNFCPDIIVDAAFSVTLQIKI